METDKIRRFADWPDYKNCIANLPNSVMKYFGVDPKGDTLPLLDRYLDREYKNIIVILLDGMGINIMERNLDADGFFSSHLAGTYSSTFPPTTVAATTSILSGQMPNEHAWLGWDCYYPQVDENVTVFFNVIQGTETPAADYNVPYRYTGYENVIDRFKKAGRTAEWAMPFVPPYPDSYEKILDRIKTLAAEPGRKYIYAYWNEPDSTMHMTGCFGRESVDMIRTLEKQTKELCGELEDSLVVITADHGHIDTKGVCIKDYPTILECLIRMPSIEPRALNLFVKPELRQQFEEEFNKYFGKSFVLMTRQEVLESRIFGTGKDHACFRDMLGDHLAVAVSDTTIFNTREEQEKFIGVHAGLTKDELTIPLIIYARGLTL